MFLRVIFGSLATLRRNLSFESVGRLLILAVAFGMISACATGGGRSDTQFNIAASVDIGLTRGGIGNLPLC
jgi:hypothetical protein